MKRENGEIELTGEEVAYLWQEIHGCALPDGELTLRDAAQTCLLTLGASKIEEILMTRERKERRFDPSD